MINDDGRRRNAGPPRWRRLRRKSAVRTGALPRTKTPESYASLAARPKGGRPTRRRTKPPPRHTAVRRRGWESRAARVLGHTRDSRVTIRVPGLVRDFTTTTSNSHDRAPTLAHEERRVLAPVVQARVRDHLLPCAFAGGRSGWVERSDDRLAPTNADDHERTLTGAHAISC